MRSLDGVECSWHDALRVPRPDATLAGAAGDDRPPAGATEFEAVHYFTVPEADGDRYRVRASVQDGASAMLVVATSLADVDSTLDRLLLIELIVTALVLGGIVALGLVAREARAQAARRHRRHCRGDRGGRSLAQGRAGRGRTRGRAPRAVVERDAVADRIRVPAARGVGAQARRFVADASHELRTPLAAVRVRGGSSTEGLPSGRRTWSAR